MNINLNAFKINNLYNRFITFLKLYLSMLLIVSCDKPACVNTNPIFNKYSPNTREYKEELIKQLAKIDKSKLTYWMSNYQEEKGLRYIYVDIQADSLCAKIVLTIHQSEKGIEGILKNKGKGYSGAELKDLQFEMIQDSTSTDFIFHAINGVVD